MTSPVKSYGLPLIATAPPTSTTFVPTLVSGTQISQPFAPSIASSSFNHKLPLPKLNAGNVNGNKQYAAVMQASAPALLQYSASLNPTRQNTGNEPWRLPKKRKRRTKLELKAAAEKALLAEKRKALENKVLGPEDTSDDEIVHSHTPPICDDAISVDTENIAKTDFMEVSASTSLPQNILASEEDSVDLSNILNERKSQMTPNEHTSTQKNRNLVEAGIETVDLTGEDEDELRTNLSNTIIQIASTNPIQELSNNVGQVTHESNSVEDHPQKDRKLTPKDTRRKESRTTNDVSNIASETRSKGMPGHSKSSLVSSTGGNKRSKNSYSIAALCQISVNIGGDPSAGAVIVGAPCEGMTVSSPGLISLTSVGTGSPIGTPAPTPTPPISTSAMTNSTLSTSTSQSISQSMSSNQATCLVPSLLSGNSISGSTDHNKAEKLIPNRNNSIQVLPDTDFPLDIDHNSAQMVAINPKKFIQELSTVSERKTDSSVGSCKSNKMSPNQKNKSKPFGQPSWDETSNKQEKDHKMENDWPGIIDKSENSQPLSPTKSYLNHFPVVSGNNKNAVNENKNKNTQDPIPKSNSRRESEPSSSKSAVNLRSNVSNLKQVKSNSNIGKPKSNISTSISQNPSNHSRTNNAPVDAKTKINPDLSVYDFTEAKQDSISSTIQSSPPFVSKKSNSATKMKTQHVSSSSESKAHISNSDSSISNTRSKTERVTSCNDSSKHAEYKNSSKSNSFSSTPYSSDSKQNQSSSTICKTSSSSQSSKSSAGSLLGDDKVTKAKTGMNTTLAKRDNASQGVAASLPIASATTTGYDLSFARSKPSVHHKGGIVPSNSATVSDTHSYLHGVSSNFQEASIGTKAPQEQPIANVSSFSPAQTFVTSTFSPGVGGSITSLSEFMNHPIQTNYSTTYSQHTFPTSIPQGQYNYHRSNVASTMTTPTPPNISSYSSTNLYYQSHHSNSNPLHQTQSLTSQSTSRKNTSVPGREEAHTLNYLPVTSKNSPLKTGYINDAAFMSSKSYHLSNSGSTKSVSGGRNCNPDEKNNSQGVSHLQYGAMFASPSSIATSGISNLQHMTSENDPSTLFSVNQLVSQKVGSQGSITSGNGNNSSSSVKKGSKRSQNSSSVKQDALDSNNQGGAKVTKQNKTVSSDSEVSKEGGVNKESSKNIIRQIQKDIPLDQGRSDITTDVSKRQSRSSHNNAHRSGSSSATNRSKSSGQSNIGASGTKRSYSAESLFSNENVLNASPQRLASSSRPENSKVPSNANRHQNQPQSSHSGDFVYPGQPMNRDNTSSSSNPSLSRSDYSWLHSSEQSHDQSTTGSNSINSHAFPPLSSAVTAPVVESHSTQMNPIMGSAAPVQTPSPISFVQEFDFPSSVLGSGGVSQTDMLSSMIFQPSLSHPSSLTSSTKTSKSQQQSSSHSHKGSFSLPSNSTVSNQAPLSSITSSSTFVTRSGNSYSSTITSAGGDANQIDVNPVGHHQQPMMSVTPSIMSDQQQQFGHQYLFDNTNLFPLPTLTPPTSIQMASTSGGPFNMDEPNNHFSHYHGSSSFYGPIPTGSAPNHTQNLLLSSSPTPPTSIPSYNLPVPNSLQPQYQTTLQNIESSQSVNRNTSRTYSSSHHSSSTSTRSYSKSPSKNSVLATSALFSASTSTNTNVGGPPQGNSLPQRQHATHTHHTQQLQHSQQHIHHDISIHQQHQQQMIIPSSPTHPTGMLSTPNAPPIVPIGSQILPQGGLHHSASVGIMSSGSQSSQQAYINFNLSTICPEINAAFVPHITEKLGMLPPSNPQSQPQPPLTHSSIPSQSATSIPTTHNTTKSSSSRSNVSNSGQAGSRGSTNGSTVTSEMVSNNVGVLGHGVTQVGSFFILSF